MEEQCRLGKIQVAEASRQWWRRKNRRKVIRCCQRFPPFFCIFPYVVIASLMEELHTSKDHQVEKYTLKDPGLLFS